MAGLNSRSRWRWRALSASWCQLVMAQPQRQGRGQPLAAGLLGRQPDRSHHWLDQRVARLGAGVRPPAGRGHRGAQELDGILALVAVVLAQLVEHPGFSRAATPLVAGSQFGQQVGFQGHTHIHGHQFARCPFAMSQRCLGPPRSPNRPGSFNLSQRAKTRLAKNELALCFFSGSISGHWLVCHKLDASENCFVAINLFTPKTYQCFYGVRSDGQPARRK